MCVVLWPTGTGKTSFIRAIASYTKRSIVNIPLSRIRTNQQLMSLMMDQQLRVSKGTAPSAYLVYHTHRMVVTAQLGSFLGKSWGTQQSGLAPG